MTNDTTYNGWTNYETWNVKLWLDNDQNSYDYWRGFTHSVWNDRARPEDYETATGITQADRDRAINRLSKALEAEHEERAQDMLDNPGNGPASVFHDLLNHSLSRVNWREIAESYIHDHEMEIFANAESAE